MSDETGEADERDLEARVDELEARVEALHRKVNSQQSFDEPETGFGDWRDRKVLGSFDVGETTTRSGLCSRYERVTGMTDSKKIKQRAKRLLKSENFAHQGDSFVRVESE